jgi:hypothetical protein
MPQLFQDDNEYIYDAIMNEIEGKPGPIFKFNPISKVYEYFNTLYPNRKYKKQFNVSHLKRGDIVHFGDNDYRNTNKLIFDGSKLECLYTLVDDYGSLPPDYVVGDKLEEFNIGDFENLIDHNEIYWLSKEILQKIILYEKNGDILGKVMIKDKEWFIEFVYYTLDPHNIESLQIYINKLSINYDDVSKRHPFNKVDDNTLYMYF